MTLILTSSISYYLISLISHYLVYRISIPVKILASKNKPRNGAFILRSVATTTVTIFLIQVLPLIFKIIEDLASDFNVSVIFSESYIGGGFLNNFDRFSALMAQIAALLQQIAPLIAVFIGGFNLLNNLSKGIAAIQND